MKKEWNETKMGRYKYLLGLFTYDIHGNFSHLLRFLWNNEYNCTCTNWMDIAQYILAEDHY